MPVSNKALKPGTISLLNIGNAFMNSLPLKRTVAFYPQGITEKQK